MAQPGARGRWERRRKDASSDALHEEEDTSLVGLDIESGSVAATEVKRTASARSGARPSCRSSPASSGKGRSGTPSTLSGGSQGRCSADYKLGKSVRLGIANQRVVVRTLELPLIEDPEELETAVRFRAQDADPDASGSGGPRPPGDREAGRAGRERMMDVLAVAARRDMVVSLVQALRKAGLQPDGIDLSAFGMIRALDDGCRRRRRSGGDAGDHDPVLPPWRRHQPGGRPWRRMPLHPSQRPSESRPSPTGCPRARRSRSRTHASSSWRSAWRRTSTCSTERTSDDRRARGARGGSDQARRGAADVHGLLRRPGGCHAGRPGRRSAEPAPRSRDCRSASRPGLGSGSRSRCRPRSPISTRRMPRD